MQSNKLRTAIRTTAAITVLGMATQSQALEINAGEVNAEIYGYARLSATYDVNENIAGPALEGTFTDVSGSENEGHFGISANQSRLGVKLTTPQDVDVVLEGHFYSGNFSLRHAYGEYNGVLAGQTWSNFNSFTGNTPVLDFNGSAGWAGYQLRSAQVRYTTGPLSVSLEDPKGTLYDDLAGDDDDRNDEVKDSMPAFTARYEGSADALSFSAAALVKQVSYENAADDDSAMGYGVFGAAKFAVSDTLSIQGSVNYTDAANSYLYLSYGDDAYVDANGDLETISGIGGSIGTSMALGGGRSVNLTYGMTKLDLDDAPTGANETNQNVILNYMWTPVENVMMGVELSHWATESNGGDSEEANRIMYAAQYNF